MRLVIAVCVFSSALWPAVSWAQDPSDVPSAATTAAPVDPDASQPAPAVHVGGVPATGFFAPFKQLPRDFVRFGTIDTLKVLAVGAAGAATAHRWDGNGSVAAQRRLRPSAFRAGNIGGNFYVQTGTALGVLSMATLAGSDRLAALGSDLLRAQILTQGVVQTGKISTRRRRPDGSNHHSLPSGHTAASFATASVLQRHYGWAVGVPRMRLARTSPRRGWPRIATISATC